MVIPLPLLCDSNRTESDSSDDGTCDGDDSGNNEGGKPVAQRPLAELTFQSSAFPRRLSIMGVMSGGASTAVTTLTESITAWHRVTGGSAKKDCGDVRSTVAPCMCM